MFVRLTRGSYVLDLAGESTRSGTQGLSISSEGGFQKADYIEADQASQFYRGGALVNVSFSSLLELPSVRDAASYMISTPRDLLDQAGQTVTIGTRITDGVKQVETLTCVGNATAGGLATWSLTGADIGTITGVATLTSGDTPSIYAPLIVGAMNNNARIRGRYIVTSSGADIIVTKRQSEADDATLVLTVGNGIPSPGITAATSVNTTAGTAPTVINAITINQASVLLNLSQTGVLITRNVTIQGRYA